MEQLDPSAFYRFVYGNSFLLILQKYTRSILLDVGGLSQGLPFNILPVLTD